MRARAYTYEMAVARLGEALTFGIHPSLDGIRALTDALGRPQDAFRIIQVTGTNGKTSVTRMSGVLLTACGYKTGVYTSPHLMSYTERMSIDGVDITPEEFASSIQRVSAVADRINVQCTEFELLTAAALVYFRDQKVNWAILEVGMGGRWDATSVVDPKVAVITGVALDHTDRLGTTREQIASDKAQIIKPGSIPIIGPGCDGVLDVFRERMAEVGSPIGVRIGLDDEADVAWRVVRRPRRPGGPLTVDIDVRAIRIYRATLHAPAYQAPNVATALTATGAALFDLRDPSVLHGALDAVTFPGRFELLREEPPLVIDGAHNPQAAGVLAEAIGETFGKHPPVLVLAVLADKDVEGIVRALVPAASAVVASANSSARCMPAADLAITIERVTGVTAVVEPDLAAAVDLATAMGDGVVVAGSLYTAGAVRALFT